MPSRSPISLRRLATWLLLAFPVAATTGTAAAQPTAARYAISASLVASTLVEHLPSLAADRIQLSSAVSSTIADPVLHLIAADLRPDGNLSLRLACRTFAECLPFFAVLSATDRADALALLRDLREAPGFPAVNAITSPASHGDRVSIGSRVRLQLSDFQMHIQIAGIAIDTAEAGHEIRIASLDRHHIYRGIVVDANTVKGDLP